MNFSLKAFIDVLGSYPEHKVMNVILEMYDNNSNGILFNEKFIPSTDIVMMGFNGFKEFLYILLDTDEAFMESCLPELRTITLTLKGDQQ